LTKKKDRRKRNLIIAVVISALLLAGGGFMIKLGIDLNFLYARMLSDLAVSYNPFTSKPQNILGPAVLMCGGILIMLPVSYWIAQARKRRRERI
jgi:hypothetical protein